MSSLGERIVAGLRAREQARPYQLERAEIGDVEDAVDWLWDYADARGDHTWRRRCHPSPRTVAQRLLWLRWVHRRRWLERGGRDG